MVAPGATCSAVRNVLPSAARVSELIWVVVRSPISAPETTAPKHRRRDGLGFLASFWVVAGAPVCREKLAGPNQVLASSPKWDRSPPTSEEAGR